MSRNTLPVKTVNAPETWSKIKPPTCDLCDRRAVWRHPSGGLRCGSCPRPEANR